MRGIINYIYHFLTDGIFYIGIIIPVFLLLRILYLKEKKGRRLYFRLDPGGEFCFLLLGVYLIMLFAQTLIVEARSIDDINLIPFAIIVQQLHDMLTTREELTIYMLNIFGNVAVFVPVGFLFAGAMGRGFLRTTFYGFFVSLIIEVSQLPLPRTTDVDDLILNTLGAAIGCSIYLIIKTAKRKD